MRDEWSGESLYTEKLGHSLLDEARRERNLDETTANEDLRSSALQARRHTRHKPWTHSVHPLAN